MPQLPCSRRGHATHARILSQVPEQYRSTGEPSRREQAIHAHAFCPRSQSSIRAQANPHRPGSPSPRDLPHPKAAWESSPRSRKWEEPFFTGEGRDLRMDIATIAWSQERKYSRRVEPGVAPEYSHPSGRDPSMQTRKLARACTCCVQVER